MAWRLFMATYLNFLSMKMILSYLVSLSAWQAIQGDHSDLTFTSKHVFLASQSTPNFIIDFQNKVTHRDEYLVTNSSYRKTSNSSRVLVSNNSPAGKAVADAPNKYVSGDVKYHRIKKRRYSWCHCQKIWCICQ